MPNVDIVHSLESYQYELPEGLIAQTPVSPRDSARMLVVNRTQKTLEHARVSDLPAFLAETDTLVVNNTRVLRARLLGYRINEAVAGQRGGKIEFLLLKELSQRVWEGAFHASAKHKPGIRFFIPTPDGKGVLGEIVRGASGSAHGTVVARFDRDPIEAGAGVMPLPPYIKRESLGADEYQYQTIYAKQPGSAAAPTAGLHFTERLRAEFKSARVNWDEITLNVGLGTFRPVKALDIRMHEMHEESYEITPQVAERLTAAKNNGSRIIAVGTTALRSLESAWQEQDKRLQAGAAKTSLFIHPGNASFKVIDGMLTNFHLPRSTLLMLVCAFGGRELIMAAYDAAIQNRYRFYSYGDAMLIL